MSLAACESTTGDSTVQKSQWAKDDDTIHKHGGWVL